MKKPKSKPQADPLTWIGCRIPQSLKHALQDIAEKEDRAYARVVRQAVKEFIDRKVTA